MQNFLTQIRWMINLTCLAQYLAHDMCWVKGSFSDLWLILCVQRLEIWTWGSDLVDISSEHRCATLSMSQCILINLMSSVLRHEDWWCFCPVKMWNETHLKHEVIPIELLPLALVTAVRHSLYEEKKINAQNYLIKQQCHRTSRRGKLGI